MRYVLLALALLPSTAGAADWKPVTQAANGSQSYIDMSSLVVDGNSRTFWQKTVDTKPDAQGGQYTVGHFRFDCLKRTEMILGLVRYKPDGNVEWTIEPDSQQGKAKDIVPESLGESFLKFVCH